MLQSQLEFDTGVGSSCFNALFTLRTIDGTTMRAAYKVPPVDVHHISYLNFHDAR